jgi:hypothetical protein
MFKLKTTKKKKDTTYISSTTFSDGKDEIASPLQSAIMELNMALGSFARLTSNISSIIEEAKTLPNFRTLNMYMLAGAYLYLFEFNNDLTEDKFRNSCVEIINLVEQNRKTKETKKLKTKIKANYEEDLLRYIRMIKAHKARRLINQNYDNGYGYTTSTNYNNNNQDEEEEPDEDEDEPDDED